MGRKEKRSKARKARKARMLIDPGVLRQAAKHVMQTNELAMTLELSRAHGATLVGKSKRTVHGEKSSVDTPSEPATLHTHSVWNYRNQVCFVGWPSGEDMRWVLGEARSRSFAVHMCVAVEGAYVITANPAIPDVRCDYTRIAAMIYRVFSSTHGRRCGDGAALSVYPDARYFQRLVRSLGADVPCVHFAGSDIDCEWDAADRREWARFTSELKRRSGTRLPFESAFIPHVLVGRDGRRYTHKEFWKSPEAHIRRIVNPDAADAYVEVVAEHAGTAIDLRRCLFGIGASGTPSGASQR